MPELISILASVGGKAVSPVASRLLDALRGPESLRLLTAVDEVLGADGLSLTALTPLLDDETVVALLERYADTGHFERDALVGRIRSHVGPLAPGSSSEHAAELIVDVIETVAFKAFRRDRDAAHFDALVTRRALKELSTALEYGLAHHVELRRLKEKFETLTRHAVADANTILRGSRAHSAIHLSDGLYVSREVEGELATHIADAETRGRLLFLVDEAGTGQTTLLWHLYCELSPSEAHAAWFIRCSLFSGSVSVATEDDLLAAAAYASSVGLSTIFLDTADLLLRSEQGLDRFRLLVDSLAALGLDVVASCRPREAALLPPRWLSELSAQAMYRRFELRAYSAAELPVALTRHASSFLAPGAVGIDADEIERWAARGRPVKEICESPLLLRMLFDLYSDEGSVPSEINAFGLYQEYWAKRVVSDTRGGDSASDRDVSRAAHLIAVILLSEGALVVARASIDWIRRRADVGGEDIDSLVSRGVLEEAEDGLLEFFHQTLFEFAAGHALAERVGPASADLVVAEYDARRGDLFLLAVAENVLVLAPILPGGGHQAAERAAARLFDTDFAGQCRRSTFTR